MTGDTRGYPRSLSRVSPFLNKSNSNQLNLSQHKPNQIKCCFFRRGENRSTRRKTSRSRVENQQTQPTYDAESENRTAKPHWWKASALPLRQPCCFYLFSLSTCFIIMTIHDCFVLDYEFLRVCNLFNKKPEARCHVKCTCKMIHLLFPNAICKSSQPTFE